jgi:hypothetical protein
MSGFWSDASISQRMPKILGKYEKSKENKKGFFLRVIHEHAPAIEISMLAF